MADPERPRVLTPTHRPGEPPAPDRMRPERYAAVARVLVRVLFLNLAVALAKILFGYTTAAVSILSDGFHSLTDTLSNAVALVGVRIAGKPPDANHPYGHRKFETLASVGVFVFLLLVLLEVLRAAVGRLLAPAMPSVSVASFGVMLGTLAVNTVVVRYEERAARRLGSEVLFADAMHTRSDVLTSAAVIVALGGTWAGYPILDPLAGILVAVFIGKAGFEVARASSRILSDQTVIAEDDLREVVMQEPGVLGCHRIRTRGSADHVFLDLHVWFAADTRLDAAHEASHRVKDRLMHRYPQIVDVIIHIEPPPRDPSAA